MNAVELLQTICEEFGIDITHDTPGIKTYIDALNAKLLANHALGHRAILIVDEAQNLSAEVLEQLRLLTNLETNTRKLLQIFLIGQPELQTLLARPEMRQVSQRVIARFNLTHLNPAEIHTYISHRLRIAGASPLIFPVKLINEVYRASGGVPRLINLICDRALLGTYVQGKEQVSLPILRHSIQEVIPSKRRGPGPRILFAGISILIVVAVFALYARPTGTGFNFASNWLARMYPASQKPPRYSLRTGRSAVRAICLRIDPCSSFMEPILISIPTRLRANRQRHWACTASTRKAVYPI
jgi:general secretion pathway protein A